jgi:hypothetical protein
LKRKKKNNPTDNQNNDKKSTPHPEVKIKNEITNHSTDDNTSEQKTFRNKIDWLTFLLVIFTASMAITSWFLYWQSREQSKLEMRAYINVSDYGVRQFIVGKEIMFNLSILNVGKTPGNNLQTRGALKIGGTDIYETDIRYKEYPYEGNSTIGANIPTKIAVLTNTILTMNDSILIITGKKPMAYLGEIVYDDIFGETHHTEYCFKYFADYKFFGDCGINNKQD